MTHVNEISLPGMKNLGYFQSVLKRLMSGMCDPWSKRIFHKEGGILGIVVFCFRQVTHIRNIYQVIDTESQNG